jgi:hypothetical protein
MRLDMARVYHEKMKGSLIFLGMKIAHRSLAFGGLDLFAFAA